MYIHAHNTLPRSPQIYRVADKNWTKNTGSDPYAMWLHSMEQHYHVVANNSLISASLTDIVRHFKSEFAGYVRSGTDVHSIAAAISFAAAGVGIVVASDAQTAAALNAAGLPLVRDVSQHKLSDLVHELLPNLTDRVLIFQDQGKNEFLGDYAVFARAGTMAYNTDPAAQQALLKHAQAASAMGVCFGWGPENDYVSDCNRHGRRNFPLPEHAWLSLMSQVYASTCQTFSSHLSVSV